MAETLFEGTPQADYLKHIKYPDAELKNWKDLEGALSEKTFLSAKQKDIFAKADQAKANVLNTHADELSGLSTKIGEINLKVNQFLINHEADFKASPVFNLEDYEVIAETKYKIKRKKESKNNAKA